MAAQLVWFITGCSTGFGRVLALEALRRGHHVVATARERSFAKLDELKEAGAHTLMFDVTEPVARVEEVARQTVELYGRIDVVVNNAGYAQAGALEEMTPEEIQNQFNTNFFGALNVSRAFLPYMRKQRSGTVLWIGSVSSGVPNTGLSVYGATKAAIRSVSESLQTEVAHLGVRSIVAELGLFRTDFCAPGHAVRYESRITDYDPLMRQVGAVLNGLDGTQPGDPVCAMKLLVDIVCGEGVAEGKAPPPVVGIGADYYDQSRQAYQAALQRIDEWMPVLGNIGMEM